MPLSRRHVPSVAKVVAGLLAARMQESFLIQLLQAQVLNDQPISLELQVPELASSVQIFLLPDFFLRCLQDATLRRIEVLLVACMK